MLHSEASEYQKPKRALKTNKKRKKRPKKENYIDKKMNRGKGFISYAHRRPHRKEVKAPQRWVGLGAYIPF